MLWEHLVTYYRMSEVYGIRIVERAEDFEDCLRGGWRLCFLLQLEGAEPIEDADDLVLLRRLGVRCITLTWNYTNKFASGCGSRKDLLVGRDIFRAFLGDPNLYDAVIDLIRGAGTR
jgi:membrane dipeptidase